MNLSMRELRKKKGLTQQQVAEAINATKRQVGAWERGENDLPMDYAFAIADLLDCTVDDIAGRSNVTYAPVTLSGALTANERELLDCYRAMTPERRETTLEDARNRAALSRREKNQADNAETA